MYHQISKSSAKHSWKAQVQSRAVGEATAREMNAGTEEQTSAQTNRIHGRAVEGVLCASAAGSWDSGAEGKRVGRGGMLGRSRRQGKLVGLFIEMDWIGLGGKN